MAGYKEKIKLNKRKTESIFMENDIRYDEYYALEIANDVFHIYGVNRPRFIGRRYGCEVAILKED